MFASGKEYSITVAKEAFRKKKKRRLVLEKAFNQSKVIVRSTL
jgi:hypothetical protein